MANTKPPPDRDRLTQAETRSEGDEERGRITHPWLEWLRDLAGVADKSPQHLFTVSLEDQQASIGATDMSDGSLSAGLYRASYYARISQAATTSSSLTVTLGWTDDGVTPSYSGAAIAGNTTTTVQSGSILIEIDGKTAVNYSTTYASDPAATMQYELSVTLEKLPT